MLLRFGAEVGHLHQISARAKRLFRAMVLTGVGLKTVIIA